MQKWKGLAIVGIWISVAAIGVTAIIYNPTDLESIMTWLAIGATIGTIVIANN